MNEYSYLIQRLILSYARLGPGQVIDDWPKDGVVINSLADFILGNVRTCPSLERYKVVPIPNLVHRLETTAMSASVAGTLVASRGTLSDFRTLRRAGDLTLSTKAGVLYIRGTVALGTLHAVFKRYSLQASVLRKVGNLLAVQVRKYHHLVVVSLVSFIYLSYGLHRAFHEDNTIQIRTILQYEFRNG